LNILSIDLESNNFYIINLNLIFMEQIKFGKKYLLSCYDYESEGIYLGTKLKRRLKNKYFFMAWHSFMKGEDEPVVIGCRNFKIKEKNKLETIGKMYFPKLSEKEREYLKELAKKYWK